MTVTVRGDDPDFITSNGRTQLRTESRISVRPDDDKVVISTDGILLEVRTDNIEKSRKHARHFQQVLAQPGWTENQRG